MYIYIHIYIYVHIHTFSKNPYTSTKRALHTRRRALSAYPLSARQLVFSLHTTNAYIHAEELPQKSPICIPPLCARQLVFSVHTTNAWALPVYPLLPLHTSRSDTSAHPLPARQLVFGVHTTNAYTQKSFLKRALSAYPLSAHQLVFSVHTTKCISSICTPTLTPAYLQKSPICLPPLCTSTSI